MKPLVILVLLAALAFFYFGYRQDTINYESGTDNGWLVNFSEAKNLARDFNKPILVNFTGSDWCGWCIRLKKEVFNTNKFKSWAEKNVILLEIDTPRKKRLSPSQQSHNQMLIKQYKVRGYPTILILDSKGSVLGKSGYIKGGPDKWIQATERAAGL